VVRVIRKESRLFVLPRASCLYCNVVFLREPNFQYAEPHFGITGDREYVLLCITDGGPEGGFTETGLLCIIHAHDSLLKRLYKILLDPVNGPIYQFRLYMQAETHAADRIICSYFCHILNKPGL
jgi:hypothetical protein